MLFYRPPVLDKSQFCLEKMPVFDSLVAVVLSPFSVLWNQTSPKVVAFLFGSLMVFWGRCSVPIIVGRIPEPSAFFSHQCQTNSQGFGIFLSPASAELPRSRYLSLTSVGRTPKLSALSLTSVGRTLKESASFSHQCRPNSQGVGTFSHHCQPNSQGVGIFPSPVSDELPSRRHISVFGSFDVVVVLPPICARSMQTPPAEILI